MAIKVLHSGADDLPIYRCFLAERQILASLDHPNIAGLFDGGVTEDGLPYLVMEYVPGLPITEYCDRNRLGIDDRLRLLRSVCAAVHYAHQNLVIHRDIKPSNILVSSDGQVKLLDFGIAKLVNPGLGPVMSPVTRTDQRAMTPEYASPEQVRADPLTTASDVYSLGIILYELLTGHHPYRLEKRSPEEVVRAVLERDPERPGARITREAGAGDDGADGITPAQLSAARGTTPERLSRQLRGDLDAIVMMALRKEPHHRYASADLLSQDVERFLASLPVTAHRGSRGYQLARLVSRHRFEAAAIALVVSSLVIGAGAAFWRASIASRERDRTRQALARAELALADSRASTDFLVQLFQAGTPAETGGDSISAREPLRRGVQRAEGLSQTPAIQASMLDVMGRVHESLGSYARAQTLLERALDIRRRTFGARSAEAAETMANLGLVMRRTGDYSRSIGYYEQAVDIFRERFGETDPIVPRTMVGLAGMYIYRGRIDDSERTYREALRIQESALGPDHPHVAYTMINLATRPAALHHLRDAAGPARSCPYLANGRGRGGQPHREVQARIVQRQRNA